MVHGQSDMSRDQLWKILVETVHALPMYENHKRYVDEVMIKERPDISSPELAVQLNIPLGEALVLLDEVHAEKMNTKITDVAESSKKNSDRSLLDFTG